MKKLLFICIAFSLAGFILFIYRFPKKTSLPHHQTPTPFPSASLSYITLQPDRSSYASENTIKITLANQTQDPIYFSDHQSNCTVVILQRLIDQNWQEENQCASLAQPITFSLESNKNTVLELSPLPTGWVKGVYRTVMVAYMQNSKDHSFTILSPMFDIQ